MTDLGTLGGPFSVGRAINARGQRSWDPDLVDPDRAVRSQRMLALDALDRHADIEAVYSIGGGNRAHPQGLRRAAATYFC